MATTVKPLFDPLAGLSGTGGQMLPNPQTNLQPIQEGNNLQLQVQPNAFTGLGTSADALVPGEQQAQVNQTQQQAVPQGGQQQQPVGLAAAVQNAALQPVLPSQTFQQVQQTAQNLLSDPTRGLDRNAQVQTQMDQFNRSVANQLDALGQQTADRFNSGQRLSDLVQANLEVAAQRPVLQQQFENQARQNELDMILQALDAGSVISGQEQKFGQQGFSNLLSAAGLEQQRDLLTQQQEFAGEQSNLDRAQELFVQSNNVEAQQALAELQGRIAEGAQLRQQDFQRTLQDIDNDFAAAMAEQDFSRALELENVRAQIAEQAAEAQREFVTNERIATQGYMTGERIAENDAQKALSILQSDLQRAINSDNIAAAERSQEKQNLFELKLATQDMGFQERMAYLSNELQNATADNDVARQKEILQFQNAQELDQIQQQQGHEAAMEELQSRLRTAEQNNDFEHQLALQDLEFEFRAENAYEDRLIQRAQLALQERDIDLQEFNTQYEQIRDINPDAAVAFLSKNLGDDFNVAKIDQKQAIMDAMAVEYEAKKAAYAQTHPDQVANGELTAEGLQGFNDFINSTMYGEGGSANEVMDAITNSANALNNPESDEYQSLAAAASDWKPVVKKDGRGFWSPDVRVISNPPAVNTPFRIGDRVLVATSGIAEETKGQNFQYFTAKDPLTGETFTIRASEDAQGVELR